MKRMLASIFGLLVGINLLVGLTASAGGGGVPQIISPEVNQVLTNYPREAYIQWAAVTGALGYDVEITCDYCNSTTTKWSNPTYYYSIPNTYYYTPALAGDNEFRVRVRSYFNYEPYNGQWSDYRYFSYNTGTNQVVKAVGDSYDFQTNGNSVSYLLDVISNDTYTDYSKLNLGVTTTPLHGTATVTPSKKISYVPTAGYTGYDDFEYQISIYDNGKFYSSKVWVTVNTTLYPSSSIQANTDNYSGTKTKASDVTVFNIDVLNNDLLNSQTPWSSNVNVSISLSPLYGTATVNSDDTIAYTSKAGHTGYDDFQYTITDSTNANKTSTAWVYVNIDAVNKTVLVAKKDDYYFTRNDAWDNSTYLLDVLNNDTYPSGSPIGLMISTTPLHGTATVDGKKIKYVPTAGYIGYDDFQYRITSPDDGSFSNYVWVTVKTSSTVSATLKAANDNFTAAKTNASDKTEFSIDVLANDAFQSIGTVLIPVTPLHGNAYVNPVNQQILYTPTPGYTGYDDFQYKITDSISPSKTSTAWVYINVTAKTTGTVKVPPAGYEYPVGPVTGYTNPFSDIDSSSLEGQAAIYLYHNAIIGGYEDGTFKANNLVNRAEISKFVANAIFNGKVKKYSQSDNEGLADLVLGQWYYDYVAAMLEANIFDGYPDKTFKAGSYINAAELSKVLVNAFKLKINYSANYGSYFKDVSSADWYAPFAYTVVADYKLFPKRTSYFNGGTYVTRGELAYAVYQIMTKYK